MTRKPPRHMPRQPASPRQLIPPAEMFSHVLPGPLVLHADKPFEQRVEIAWRRLQGQFNDDEQPRLLQILLALLGAGRTPLSQDKEALDG